MNRVTMHTHFGFAGNGQDPKGNAIPYYRITQRSKFKDPGAKRYAAWKEFVGWVAIETKAMPIIRKIEKAVEEAPEFERKIKVDVDIIFSKDNHNHADPDNVKKGIHDALFVDDKYIMGMVDFHYGKDPRVDVYISLVEGSNLR